MRASSPGQLRRMGCCPSAATSIATADSCLSLRSATRFSTCVSGGPTKLFITQDIVALDWGSGLVGFFSVAVHAEPVAEEIQNDALYTTRRIHPRVTLTWE